VTVVVVTVVTHLSGKPLKGLCTPIQLYTMLTFMGSIQGLCNYYAKTTHKNTHIHYCLSRYHLYS